MPMPLDALAAVTHADPYPFYRELVTHRPLYRDERLGLWVASGAAVVEAVLASEACRVRPPAEKVPRMIAGTAAGEVFGCFVRMNDGPLHVRLKRIVSEALGRLQSDEIDAAARSTLARLDADGLTLEELLFQLPVEAMAALLGTRDVAAPTHALVRSAAPGCSAAAAVEGDEAAAALTGRMRMLLKAAPTPLLRHLRDAGEAEDEIVANAVGFLFQSYEATAALVGNAFAASATRAVSDARAFVREVVRHDAAVQNTRRFVIEDATIAGERLAAGDTVLVVLAAANRDPAANPDPDRFDEARPSPRLFTFGASRHACPGETIAVAVAAAALELIRPKIEPERLVPRGYRPSANIRCPVFG